MTPVLLLLLLYLLPQAVIGNYAVPILEDKKVWGTNDDSRTAYMDTQVRTSSGAKVSSLVVT
jgi:hypothetical protein